MIFLQGHGVSPAYSAKIYKHYGKDSIAVVKENPYRLARDMYGISFITADKIAQHIGIDPNSLIRAKAGLIYVLNQLTDEGHTHYPQTELTQKAREILKVDKKVIRMAIAELSREKKVFLESLDTERSDDVAVYLASLFVAEKKISDELKRLKESPSKIRPIHPEKAIE